MPAILELLLNLGVIQIILIVFVFALGLAASMTLLGDRKQSALIQNRVGPNRARLPFINHALLGFPHFIADGIKMVLKENVVHDGAHKGLHLIAPGLVFVPALLGWAAIPFMDTYCAGEMVVNTSNWTEMCSGEEHRWFQIMNLNSGLLYGFAIASVSVYGAAIAGWASNNNYSLLGGLRSSAQMVSYEVSLGLSLAGILMIYGTLDFNEMVKMQGYLIGDWVPMWGIVVQPVAFFLFFFAGMAETKRAPFDLPEAEPEIVAGYITEYSSMKFGIMQLGEYVATVFISALIVLIFLGGWQVPWLFADGIHMGSTHVSIPYAAVIVLRVGAMALKVVFIVWLQFMLRWTLPRFRYDQVMTLGWKILLPLALANLVVTALILALI